MSDLQALLRQARDTRDYGALLELIPYARLLAIECRPQDGEPLFRLPANKELIGNPVLPAIHGGVIAGFMEHAALVHLLLCMGTSHFPKIIDFSIDYLRAGLYRDTYARCQVWRQGRRVANVAVTAWQADRNEPIATARAHFKIDEPRMPG
ncbi:PaaI family thioesterase [Phytopseudomonas dryadis]|uniref:Thioesterase n=1 Tax=Phytopseudomonas dryadis TaxID=2487520 RepID=A0A4Q9RA55_9GAMM|nr:MULTISPECIES: PaaI family thioesterase [Pseudomonas]TBU97593.1 thioesterase [Pseudomonas dryadis]TBV10048.1 thioesterase [Pseudomonas dryadis]TBV19122.1 thioesterase [Pseudomonas sp. FRB 230]